MEINLRKQVGKKDRIILVVEEINFKINAVLRMPNVTIVGKYDIFHENIWKQEDKTKEKYPDMQTIC